MREELPLLSNLFLAVVALALLLAWWVAPPSMSHMLALLVLLVVSGLPHGALDVLLLRRLGRRWRWWMALYAAVALLVVGLWRFFPGWMFGIFLLISWFHFGVTDRLLSGRLAGGLEGVARGGAPLCLVAGLHSAEALELFSWLVPVVAAEQAVSSLQRLLPLWAAALLATLWLAARGRAWRVVTELLALLLLFWQLPPLAAFALYFALLHAPRSILLLPPLLPGLAGRQWLAAALWPTALSLAAALLALGWLQRLEGVALEQSLVQVLFIGLAALTLPHVLLWGWLALRPPGAAVR